jgi:RimJ/RimL family protein N-acetyltransferase
VGVISPTALNTARLVLRPFATSHLDSLAALVAKPEVMEWILPRRPLDSAEAAELLERFCQHWRVHGYGPWAVEDAESGALIGRVGPWFLTDANAVEFGWAFDPSVWGRGLAAEAAVTALRYAFVHDNMEYLFSDIFAGNERSIRLALRLQMSLRNGYKLNNDDVVVYGIHRGEFITRRQPVSA